MRKQTWQRTKSRSLEAAAVLPTRFQLGRESGGLDSGCLKDLHDAFGHVVVTSAMKLDLVELSSRSP